MRTSHLFALAGFLFFFVVIAAPARGPHPVIRTRMETDIAAIHIVSQGINAPPIASDDTYTLHGNGTIGPLLQNDSDPENDPMHVQIVGFPTQGQLFGIDGNSFTYGRNSQGFFGSDSFTYKACDNSNACSDVATVTVNIVNHPPVAVDDSYTVHGGTTIGPMLANDSDADGDPITWNLITAPGHGTLLGKPNPSPADVKDYAPNTGFVGSDSFTYKACDRFGTCSSPATVTLNINNSPPIPGADFYTVRGGTDIGPLFANDYDPEGDSFIGPFLTVAASHGTVIGLAFPLPNDMKQFVPEAGFSGVDTWEYEITDYLGAGGRATVTLFVLDNDDAENAGKCSSCAGAGGAVAVGGPVNVTNGNMYMQQTDFHLPGVGPELDITRTYNSSLRNTGIFGRGWSTVYDASIKAYDLNFIRLNLPDGRAVYFTRPNSSAAFAPVEPDFHGQMIMNGDGSFTLSLKDHSTLKFNTLGKLDSLADRYNNQTTLTYNSGGKLASVSDPFGRLLSINTNTSGQAVSIGDSMGVIATYTYGPSNELLSITYTDNSVFRFSYDDNFRMTSVTDALGNILEAHTYDAQGRSLTSEKQGGVERYTLNYVSETQTDVTDALGHLTKYTFDKSKGRNVVTRAEGVCSCGGSNSQIQTWNYDSQLNVSSKTDALNHTISFTYDAEGNRLTQTDTTGTVAYTYNSFGEVLTRTDQMSGVATNTYDASGKLLTTIDAVNNATTFTYDVRGQLATMTNARGYATTLSHDPNGNIAQASDAMGGITKFTYDARGRVTSATDALSFVTSYAYDAAGRLNKITRPDLTFIIFTYDIAGRPTKVTDALNNSTSRRYDSSYRLTGETDALGISVSYAYDAMSNLTSVTDQMGRTTNVEYDDFNRPVKTILPAAATGLARLEETIAYDPTGRVTNRTDRAGRVSLFEYDAANRLIKVTDPALQTTHYEYDSRSNMTAMVDAINQRYTFAYDAVARVTTAMRAGLQMSFAYDAVGNRTQRTDYNNVATTYAYDPLNRLAKVSYPDGSMANYGYNKVSQLTSATNSNGTVTFVYDNMWRTITTTDVFGQVLNYAYDGNGRRTKLSFGATTNATYVYDPLDRLTKITDNSKQAITYSYDATSKVTMRNLPNNVETTYSYDGQDRLTASEDMKGNKVIGGNQYSYNEAGNITRNIDPAGTHSYGYDLMDRLTTATYTATPNETYAYDAVGNRTSSHRSPTYGYQPFNRLINSSAASYLYDNNRNMISKSDASGTTQFGWDFENRLTQIVTPTRGSVNYKYDALGRRIQRATTGGVSTNFTYDRDDVVQDINSDGSTVEYLNGPGIDNKIRQKGTSNSTTYYFLRDQLGSTTALTGHNGKVVEQIDYDAYGNSAGATRTRYDYTGRERDPDTGLMYYRARWYDPQVGRFISEDPIGLAGGVNPYAYVRNNPQNATDPSGLYEIDVHYYLTYYLALKTGCYSAAEASVIANADQGVDENPATAPAYGNSERQRQINAFYHGLHPGSHLPYLQAHWAIASMGSRGNVSAFGIYLHYLQDVFSHQGFTDPEWGHSPRHGGTHSNDKTSYDVDRTMAMAHATWNSLFDFANQTKRCGCKRNGDPEMWTTVREFAEASGGGPWDRHRHSIDEIDPWFLENKRRILDVMKR